MKHIKRQLSILTVGLISLTTLFSCGGGNNSDEDFQKSVELTPNTTEIKGYLGDVLQVVEGSYKFDYKAMYGRREGNILIKIKSIKGGDANDYGLQDERPGPLYLTICDASGKPLAEFSDAPNKSEGDGLLIDMLNKDGEENWIPFHIYQYESADLPDEATTFFVTSRKVEESESSSANESSSNDCDKLLKGYEKFMDNYVALLKKYKNNPTDATISSEYASLMSESAEWSSKIGDCATDANFASKFSAIQMKMATAISDNNDSNNSKNSSIMTLVNSYDADGTPVLVFQKENGEQITFESISDNVISQYMIEDEYGGLDVKNNLLNKKFTVKHELKTIISAEAIENGSEGYEGEHLLKMELIK